MLTTTKLSVCRGESGLITIPLLPVERAGIAATLDVGERRDTWLASLPRGALHCSIELNSCQSQSRVEKQLESLFFWLFFKWGCYSVLTFVIATLLNRSHSSHLSLPVWMLIGHTWLRPAENHSDWSFSKGICWNSCLEISSVGLHC